MSLRNVLQAKLPHSVCFRRSHPGKPSPPLRFCCQRLRTVQGQGSRKREREHEGSSFPAAVTLSRPLIQEFDALDSEFQWTRTKHSKGLASKLKVRGRHPPPTTFVGVWMGGSWHTKAFSKMLSQPASNPFIYTLRNHATMLVSWSNP